MNKLTIDTDEMTLNDTRKTKDNKQLQRVTNIAAALINCGAQAEYEWYLQEMHQALDKIFRSNKVNQLFDLLNTLRDNDYDCAEMIYNMLETHVEHFTLTEFAGQTGLLFVMPVVACSFYQIPTMNLNKVQLEQLSTVLKQNIFSAGSTLVLDEHLYSVQQLPEDMQSLLKYRNKLSKQLGEQLVFQHPAKKFNQPVKLMSDIRYLLGVVLIGENNPPFSWNIDSSQSAEKQMYQVLKTWREQASSIFAESFPSCSFELLLPYAFHEGIRQSELYCRRYCIENSLLFLRHKLDIASEDLTAVLAIFGNEYEKQELRISFFTDVNSNEADFALALPSVSDNQAGDLDGLCDEIGKILSSHGVTRICRLDYPFALEYCDDCQAPLFANLNLQLLHTRYSDEDYDLGEILH